MLADTDKAVLRHDYYWPCIILINAPETGCLATKLISGSVASIDSGSVQNLWQAVSPHGELSVPCCGHDAITRSFLSKWSSRWHGWPPVGGMDDHLLHLIYKGCGCSVVIAHLPSATIFHGKHLWQQMDQKHWSGIDKQYEMENKLSLMCEKTILIWPKKIIFLFFGVSMDDYSSYH